MQLVPLDDDSGGDTAPAAPDPNKPKLKLVPLDDTKAAAPKDSYLSEGIGALKTGAKEFAQGAVDTVKGMGKDYAAVAAQHPGALNMAGPIYGAGAALKGLADSPAAEFAESAILGSGGVEAGPARDLRLKNEPVPPSRVATALRSGRQPETAAASKITPPEPVAQPGLGKGELPTQPEGATPPPAPAAAPKLKLVPLDEPKPKVAGAAATEVKPEYTVENSGPSTSFAGSSNYRVKDATGEHVLTISAKQEGDSIKIGGVGGGKGEITTKNMFGTPIMRKILPQLQEHFPTATNIEGLRVTGSKAGQTAKVKLKPLRPSVLGGPRSEAPPSSPAAGGVPPVRPTAPGSGGVPQSAGAAARGVLPPAKVTRPQVMDLETRLYDMQGRKQVAVLDAAKEMQSRPPDMAASEERLFRAGEGDPGVALTPREQQLFDERIAPARAANEEQWKRVKQLGRKLHLSDEEVEGLQQSDPNHYMPRFNKDYTHDMKGLTEEEVHDPLMPATLHGRAAYEAPSQKSRTYYALENKAGQRELVHVEHGGFRHVVDKDTDGQFISVGKDNKPGPGIKVQHDGQEWTAKEAYTSEIEAKADHSYVKHATSATQLNKIYLTRAEEELSFAHNIKAELQDQKLASTDRAFARKKGFRQVSFPGLANTYVEPRMANVLDKFSPYKPGDDWVEWMAGANRFLTGTMFGTPIPHIRNISELYFQDRAFAWTNPAAYPRMKESIKDAYKAVTTQNKLYQDIMTHGGSMMAARDYGREFFEQSTKEVLKLEGTQQARSIGMKLAMAPKEFVQAWWAASHKALFKFQDIATVARVRERMLEQGLETPEAVNAAMRQTVKETHEGMPSYRQPVEVPHPDISMTVGGKTFSTAKAAALPHSFYTSPFGRMATNFTRYNYGLATATFRPPVKALMEASRAIKYAAGGDPRAKKAFASALDGVLKTAALMLTYQVALPFLDRGAQKWTGDERSRVTRWGSLSIIQALDDVLHGKATNWDVAKLLIFSPAPMLGMATDVGGYFMGKQQYGKPVTMGQTAKDVANQVPIVSQLSRPASSGNPVANTIGEQVVGLGKRPMTDEELKEYHSQKRASAQ